VDRSASGDSAMSGLAMDESGKHIRQQDLDVLKQAAVTVLSESMFKKILEINQVSVLVLSY